MTAETLKPFLTPANVDNYVTASDSSASSVYHRRSRYFIAIAASALVVVLATTLMGLTIWNTVRIGNLQTDVANLNRVIESMQKRLGLTYLDDLNELDKDDENNNALIDDELPDDDEDDDDDNDSEMNSGDDYEVDDDGEEEEDDDDDEDYFTYDELMRKYNHYDDDDDDDDDADAEDDIDNDGAGEREGEGDVKSDGEGIKNSKEDTVGDDNIYEDFDKYLDSKKKTQGQRKTRSVPAINDLDVVQKGDPTSSHRSHNHKSIVAVDHAERRRSPMRPYSSRRRKLPLIKSAKTLATNVNAFNEVETTKPAAHFHLTHKVPYHHSTVRVHTYHGDMYIGKPSWTNERDTIDNFFHVENGVLTVHESGLYYVYAQVCYNNHYAQNGFIIFHGHEPFLQCLSNIFTNNNTVINTCHTSGLIYLKRDEHIHIRDFHADRRAFLAETNNRSYFGLIKI